MRAAVKENMSKVRVHITVSADGYVAGPNQSPGPWGDDPWRGWWGEEPPFHMPVFVLPGSQLI